MCYFCHIVSIIPFRRHIIMTAGVQSEAGFYARCPMFSVQVKKFSSSTGDRLQCRHHFTVFHLKFFPERVYRLFMNFHPYIVSGKLYKSRVCFTKHLWEHSIYWDLFDGAKNQDRVLSIQVSFSF